MEKITNSQIIKFNTLLNSIDITNLKRQLIMDYSNGRTMSTKELTKKEATKLINDLSEYDPRKKIIRAIWKLAYDMGIIYGNTKQDMFMNAAKLNKFLREKGTVKKDVQTMNMEELKKTHRQFEAMLRNSLRSADNKVAKKATARLLKELQLTTK